MPIRPLRKKRAVYFHKMASTEPVHRAHSSHRIVELADTDPTATPSDIAQLTIDDDGIPPVPALFTNLPPIRDDLVTESSETQDRTVEECLPFLSEPGGDLNVFGVSQLERKKHLRFCHMMLKGPYPAAFVAADASRPWMVYWALTGLYVLGEDIGQYRER
jgi:hypothetical protein